MFPCLTLSWNTIIFRIYVIETKLDFVSFDDKNLKSRRKCVSERDFPRQNSFTGQAQCLSHSKDQIFVTSLTASSPSFSRPATRAPRRACSQAKTILIPLHVVSRAGVLSASSCVPAQRTSTERANSVFSHDVTEAILVCQNNETAAMLVSQTSPLVDCKTVDFFLKISKELGIAWRKSLTREAREPHTPVFLASLPVSLSVFSLVPDLLFDCSRVLEQEPITCRK